MKVKTLLFALAVPSLVLACGGNKPEPASSSSTPPVASTTTSPTTEDASAAPSTASTPPASIEDAGPPPPPPAKPPVVLGETKDECTPVGVDFEKRARPKLKECYAEGKKKAPTLEGSVKIKVTVDVKGKIKSVKVIEKTLPDAVADCMLKAVKATPFPEVDKCWDASITLPITFPTPK